MFNNKAWEEYRRNRLLIVEYAALFFGIGLLLFGSISWFRFVVFNIGQPVSFMLLLGTVTPFFLGYILLRMSRIYFKKESEKPRKRAFDIFMGLALLVLFFSIFVLIEFMEKWIDSLNF